MSFKVMGYLALFCVLFSCEDQNIRKYQHNIEDYDSIDDYAISTRDQFREFLDKYYDKMKKEIPNLKGKAYLVENFVDAGDKAKWYIPWVKKSLLNYNQRFSIQTIDNIFNFHLYQPKDIPAKGTLIYVHVNLTSPTLGWEFLVEYSKYFKDYNFISVDLMNVSRNKRSFNTDELNEIFEQELIPFLKKYNLEKTNIAINVSCRSFAFTHKFFKQNPQLYKKAIFYTPVVKESKTDKYVRMGNIYDRNKKTMLYHNMSNFYQLPRGNNQNAKIIPKSHQLLNLETEFKLANDLEKGFSPIGIHDRYMIYPEYEGILSFEMMDIGNFSPENIFMLKGMNHNDYYTNKEKWERYFKVIHTILDL